MDLLQIQLNLFTWHIVSFGGGHMKINARLQSQQNLTVAVFSLTLLEKNSSITNTSEHSAGSSSSYRDNIALPMTKCEYIYHK